MSEHNTPDSPIPAGPLLDAARPADLRLDRREGLFITWADGHRSHYSLEFLRKNCPCATCREEREQKAARPVALGRSLPILPPGISRAVEFADAKLVGRYAMQIVWGDGHSTGIYDFRLLRQLDTNKA